MNYKYLMLLFSVVLFSSFVFSYTIGFDYAEVRTTSFPIYGSYQYAYNYDTIDLRYAFSPLGVSSPVNIVVSPKVYGINLSGQRVFVHNIQTQTFLVQPSGFYTYTYNPMFYFDPAYQSYEVVLDLQALDGSYYTSRSTYIYSQGSSGNSGNNPPPINPPSENPTCNDFSISGFSDIYLEEDRSDVYNLYIINTINTPLTITSITTNPTNPQNLEIQNISHPYTINGYQTRSAQINLFADVVSSNYTGYFDVKVIAKYNNLTCEKIYPVKYRINNSNLENNASCNDIRVLDKYFTISQTENKTVDIKIENKSLDYYFEVNDVKIIKPSSSVVDASIRNSIFRINEDSSRNLTLNLRTQNATLNKTENLTLKIDGYLKRTNREDRRCKIDETITVRVLQSSSQNTNECKDIVVYTRNINQEENTTKNYSIENGFYLYNNSNKKFTITGINYSDNSLYADIISKYISLDVFPKSTNSLNFDVKTSNVSSNSSLKGNITVQGNFENGASCSFSDIKKDFDIQVIKKEDLCSSIGIVDSSFKSGENLVTVYNNTNTDFSVNDIIYQNNQNTNINVIDKAFTLPKNSQKTFRVGASGVGSFELLLKGQFASGKSCDYKETKSGYLSSYGYNFSDSSCNYNFTYPNIKYISLEGDFIEFSFRNLTNKSGVIKLSATGAVIENPIINFSAYSDITRKVNLTNIKNPKVVLYTVDIYGCSQTSYFTNLYSFTNNVSEDISLVSYTSNISSIENRILSNLSLKNNSPVNSFVNIRFSGFPNNFNFVVSDEYLSKEILSNSQNKSLIQINPNSTKNINFGVIVPQDAENRKYNGYIEVYSKDVLVLKEPFTIDRVITKEGLVVGHFLEKGSSKENVILTFVLENNLSLKRNLYLSFEDENNYSIEGEREVVLEPFSKYSASYKIKYMDTPLLKYKIIDSDTGMLVYSGETDLKNIKEEPSFLSGFFSLGFFKGWLFWVILLVIILLIYFVYYGYKKKNNKSKKQTLKIKEEVIENNSEIKQESSLFLETKDAKQITLKDLDSKDN